MSDVWICACVLWDKEFGLGQDGDEFTKDGAVEWEDEIGVGGEERDRILAEKLNAEWRGKVER
jgi:hypothetical protein